MSKVSGVRPKDSMTFDEDCFISWVGERFGNDAEKITTSRLLGEVDHLAGIDELTASIIEEEAEDRHIVLP